MSGPGHHSDAGLILADVGLTLIRDQPSYRLTIGQPQRLLSMSLSSCHHQEGVELILTSDHHFSCFFLFFGNKSD